MWKRLIGWGSAAGIGLAGAFTGLSMLGQASGIDAAYVWYTPEDAMDWTVSGGPGEVAPALDELAQRATDIIGDGGSSTHLARWTETNGLQDSLVVCNNDGSLTTSSDAWAIYGRTVLEGPGGSLIVRGGTGIGYGNDGGDLTFQGGSSVYGTPGSLTLGDANTDAVNIGAAGVPIGITGAQTWTGTVTNYDAQTVLAAIADDTPTAITLNEQTLLGRLTAGNVAAVSIGIADNNIVQVDHDSGVGAGVGDDDYAKFTAAGLEGRSYTELRSDINVEDGADVTDATNVEAAGAIMDSDFDGNGWMARTGAGVYEDRTLSAGIGLDINNVGTTYTVGLDATAPEVTLGDTPSPRAVGRWFFIELDESDFTGGANQETLTLFVDPAAGVIEFVSCRVTEQPVQGGMATCIIEVGTAANRDKYTNETTFNWNQAVNAFNIYGPVANNLESYSATTAISVRLTVTGLGATTGGLAAGTAKIYIKISAAL